MTRSVLVVLWLGAAVASAEARAAVVSELGAEYRNGQVFLTWREAPVPPGTTFNVYFSRRPVVDEAAVAAAARVCQWIEPRSAEDWTRDAGYYGKGRVPDPKTGKTPPPPAPVGYILQDGGNRLDPTSGLHVHTVAEDEQGDCYYAVTVVMNGRENRRVVPGENALRSPVAQQREPIRPIWQGAGRGVAIDSGSGKRCTCNCTPKATARPANFSSSVIPPMPGARAFLSCSTCPSKPTA